MTENDVEIEEYKRKKDYGLIENKLLKIKKVDSFEIDKFRLFQNQNLILGSGITILSGRNGTMKSTLLGLMSHPYETDKVDVHGRVMKTKFDDVFKFSLQKDKEKYLYKIKMVLDDNKKVIEPIPVYIQTEADGKIKRHRIVPSGRAKGDGFFNLPTLYTNLKRLYPLIDSGNVIISNNINYTDDEKKEIGNFYQNIILKSDFKTFETYSNSTKDRIDKKPFGPSDSYFDISSISSGEDNLSTFINAMISFERVKKNINDSNQLTGIWAIDEFEASLHPSAQLNLLKYLLKWSIENRVQILLNTHSLYLIEEIYKQFSYEMAHKEITINFISQMYQPNNQLDILVNPEYKVARKELTLTDSDESLIPIKIKLLCEDNIAKYFLRRIISKTATMSRLEILYASSDENSGTPANNLAWVCKNFPKLLTDNNSLIIFDADQKQRNEKLKTSLSFVLPSVYGQPLEQELVTYILDKDTGDNFFKNCKKTKEMFKQEFSNYHIDIDTTSNTNIKKFKNWYNKEKGQKYLTYYLKDNKTVIETFRQHLIKELNNICNTIGLPPVE